VRTVAEIWGQEGCVLWAGAYWVRLGGPCWQAPLARSGQEQPGRFQLHKEILEGSGALLSLQFKPLQDGQSNLEAK